MNDKRRVDSNSKAAPSLISLDMEIDGNMASQGEIQIDGRVNGDVKCSQLVIGSSGAVHGEITADKIRIHGAVTGKIISKTVFLSQTAKVKGDIVHESLAIEPGARVEGMCSRLNDESKRQLVSDATAEKKAAVKA